MVPFHSQQLLAVDVHPPVLDTEMVDFETWTLQQLPNGHQKACNPSF